MMMPLQFKITLFLSAIMLMMSTQSFATEKYAVCSTSEIKQVNQRYALKLRPEALQNNPVNSFNDYACIKTTPNHQFIFVYISEDSPDSNENQDYNLSILVLDAQQKLLNRFNQKNFIEFTGLEFEGIRLENVAFSTLTNSTVFGLSSRESKFGDPSLSNHELNLFKLNPSGKIQQILFHFPSYTHSSLSRPQCHAATTDLVDRKLILSDQLHHGLQDIIIKETKTSHGSDYKTCKTSENKYKRQHIMKFNGERYIFNERNFLQSDGI